MVFNVVSVILHVMFTRLHYMSWYVLHIDGPSLCLSSCRLELHKTFNNAYTTRAFSPDADGGLHLAPANAYCERPRPWEPTHGRLQGGSPRGAASLHTNRSSKGGLQLRARRPFKKCSSRLRHPSNLKASGRPDLKHVFSESCIP